MDGVSLPATSKYCVLKEEVGEATFGAYRYDTLWTVPVLHPGFTYSVKTESASTQTHWWSSSKSKHIEDPYNIEVMLTSDSQPTMQRTSPFDQFIKGITSMGCAISINPQTQYTKITLTPAVGFWTALSLWFTVVHSVLALVVFLFPSGSKEFAKRGPVYFRFGKFGKDT